MTKDTERNNQIRSKVLDFANKIQAGFLGTIDAGKPRVRGVLLWFADESGFYFHTSKSKDLHHQLRETPFTEVAFFRSEPAPAGTMLRVAGSVEFLEDPQLKERLLSERPWLIAHGERLREKIRTHESSPEAELNGNENGTSDENAINPDNMLSIFRIVKAECRFWSSETNMREKEAPVVQFP